jgi:hypothetical protein
MSTQFAGLIASVYSFVETHRLLIVRLSDPNHREPDVFIKCWFCTRLPDELKWTISRLITIRPSDYSTVLLDVDATIAIFCTEATVTGDLELRGVPLI